MGAGGGEDEGGPGSGCTGGPDGDPGGSGGPGGSLPWPLLPFSLPWAFPLPGWSSLPIARLGEIRRQTPARTSMEKRRGIVSGDYANRAVKQLTNLLT